MTPSRAEADSQGDGWNCLPKKTGLWRLTRYFLNLESVYSWGGRTKRLYCVRNHRYNCDTE